MHIQNRFYSYGFIIILRLFTILCDVIIVFLTLIYLTDMGFLRTVLIILLVYYLFKIVIKLCTPKLLNYAGKKVERHFKEKFDGFHQHQQEKSSAEGNVVFDRNTKKKSNSSKKVGEYIDFEEID